MIFTNASSPGFVIFYLSVGSAAIGKRASASIISSCLLPLPLLFDACDSTVPFSVRQPLGTQPPHSKPRSMAARSPPWSTPVCAPLTIFSFFCSRSGLAFHLYSSPALEKLLRISDHLYRATNVNSSHKLTVHEPLDISHRDLLRYFDFNSKFFNSPCITLFSRIDERHETPRILCGICKVPLTFRRVF